jgi:cysteine desulfurase
VRRVYLDHNATSPLRPAARRAFLECAEELAGNASSVHAEGRRARHVLDLARERVAQALGVDEDEIVFTSGGTESNNLALFGASAAVGEAARVVVAATEHSSVLAPAAELGRAGRALDVVPVDGHGLVDLERLAQCAAKGPSLVSVMTANNEIGTCAPMHELRARLRSAGANAVLHTDAVQALGRIPVRLREWGVDLASFSAHKVGGPTGVGVLFRRRGAACASRILGGEQEQALRAGTENVPAIVAAAEAIVEAVQEQPELARRLVEFSNFVWGELGSTLRGVRAIGLDPADERRLPGTLALLVPDTDGKVLVTRLDVAGLACSAGSACASGSIEPSHVLRALGLGDAAARAGLRLSMGWSTTWTDVREAVNILGRTLAWPSAKRDALSEL